jgi:nucleoside-diphosphate-sugar epimerase
MTASVPVAAVTGAYGYHGSLIRTTLDALGWKTVALVRSPRPDDPAGRPFQLAEPLEASVLEGIDLLVHCAYDYNLTRRDDIWRVNVNGTERLLKEAEAAGIRRIVVLSSMSAYEGTRQLYGQARLAIEEATEAVGGCVIRPGLVYGNQPRGMAGALRNMTKLPITPLVGGNAHQFLVHEDDFVAAITALMTARTVPQGPIGIAHPSPVPFRSLLEALAAADGRRCRFIPVPWQLLYAALRISEMFHIKVPFRADSLLGLVRPAPYVAGVEKVVSMGVQLQSFNLRPIEGGS